jgi:hypothetical protein
MPDDAPQSTPPSSTVSDLSSPPAASAQPPIPFDIGEEFGTANKNLPPLKIVGIAVAVIVVIAAVVGFVQKPRQKATGAIENIVAAEIPNQNQLMVSVALSIHNLGEKPFMPREVKAEIETDAGSFSDQAASAVDFPRYVQAFPALAGDGTGPLQFEKPVQPGGETKGTIIVTFPVTADVFAKRKLLRLTITGPDQLVPLVLTK